MPKILIVEDNEENRDSLSRRLQRRGFTVVTAADGRAGLTAAQTEKPDLILMDMNMPELDGWGPTRPRAGEPGLHPNAHEHAARGRRGGAPPVEGVAGAPGPAGHRPDGPRHVRRPRAGPAEWLRRLPHQAGRVLEAARAD